MIHEHSADKLKCAANGRKKRGEDTKTEEETMKHQDQQHQDGYLGVPTRREDCCRHADSKQQQCNTRQARGEHREQAQHD